MHTTNERPTTGHTPVEGARIPGREPARVGAAAPAPGGVGRALLLPIAATGVLMAAYQLVRPYGDVAGGTGTLDAIASPWWLVAHIAALFGLAAFALAAVRLADVDGSRTARAARVAALAGAALVLPAYGVEAFGLHLVGQYGEGSPIALAIFHGSRENVTGLVFLAGGLLGIAVAGVLAAIAFRRRTGSWTMWPVAIAMALVMPAFLLPPAGRMAFGMLTLVAAAIAVFGLVRTASASAPVASHS
ncbi:hypothetical protein F8O01_00045 [Pseudoclavibacter chungangensis]|uniref:DUF4386 family protein n=1 Tax=Pseudoclavibacter chungangensis TaxID=587635 RepID=A0A7J5C2H0_9MICO|nr:hypothetical protein [Pseudoclavibacter chungangensis]KAB1662382.1 hypothetical protein F8O01_00045 [Pseudoclavibacter chungangensis]NYJ68403.1 hypothetical protein [Pseudoclavibacter chungangensis]